MMVSDAIREKHAREGKRMELNTAITHFARWKAEQTQKAFPNHKCFLSLFFFYSMQNWIKSQPHTINIPSRFYYTLQKLPAKQ